MALAWRILYGSQHDEAGLGSAGRETSRPRRETGPQNDGESPLQRKVWLTLGTDTGNRAERYDTFNPRASSIETLPES